MHCKEIKPAEEKKSRRNCREYLKTSGRFLRSGVFRCLRRTTRRMLGMKDKTIFYEHLIIGSGLAGLTSALMLAEKSKGRICVITKGNLETCNSRLAQGGIACVLDKGDTFDEHIADTLAAGAHLCNAVNVREIVEAGPEKIKWLMDLGTHFTTRGEIGENNEEQTS